MTKRKQIVDPPQGWRFGFPAILEDGESYEALLRKRGYPEKDIEFALRYSRYWYEDVETDRGTE